MFVVERGFYDGGVVGVSTDLDRGDLPACPLRTAAAAAEGLPPFSSPAFGVFVVVVVVVVVVCIIMEMLRNRNRHDSMYI